MQNRSSSVTSAILFICVLYAYVCAYPPAPVPTVREKLALQKKITRTLSLLRDGKPVKIVFFGQSLTDEGQKWYQQFGPWIRSTYPNADITITNRSVAGCASDCLAPKVRDRISGENADLIIFHVYARTQESYEDVIKSIKSNSPATMELLAFNDHVHHALENPAWHDEWSYIYLPLLTGADRYNFGLVNIRAPWKRYLAAHHGDTANWGALTSDGVHFNDEGHYLILELFKRYITGGGYVATIGRLSPVAQTNVRSGSANGTMWDLRGAAMGSRPHHGAMNGVMIVRLAQGRMQAGVGLLPLK